eukprot:scaffold5532_cov180-Amphora_coffeaeformis.AAC.8
MVVVGDNVYTASDGPQTHTSPAQASPLKVSMCPSPTPPKDASTSNKVGEGSNEESDRPRKEADVFVSISSAWQAPHKSWPSSSHKSSLLEEPQKGVQPFSIPWSNRSNENEDCDRSDDQDITQSAAGLLTSSRSSGVSLQKEDRVTRRKRRKPDRFVESEHFNHKKRPKRCGSCERCRKEDRGSCSSCIFKIKNNYSKTICVKKPCCFDRQDQSVEKRQEKRPRTSTNVKKKKTSNGICERKSVKKREEASIGSAALVARGAAATWIDCNRRTQKCDLKEGDKVCAMWRDGGALYWGVVQTKFYVSLVPFYNIRFADGDKRNRVPRAQIMSVEEFIEEYDEETFERTAGMHDVEVEHEVEEDMATKKSATTKKDNSRAEVEEDTVTIISSTAKKGNRSGEEMIHDHPLLGAFVLRKWLDISLKERRLCGKVVECRKDPFAKNALEFGIDYPDTSLACAREFLPGWEIEQREFIPEGTAWGCSQAFDYGDNVIMPEGAPVWKWIIPDDIIDTPSFPPKRRLWVTEKNVIIDLEVKDSSIPNAGMGLFAKVSPVVPAPDQQRCCVLKYGEMVDLGIYSPVLRQDIRPNPEVLVKSFIFDGKPEEWAYGQRDVESDTSFDITDDVTGDLHYMAKRNALVYVNEINGDQMATVHAQRDPFSHVHYMLGPDEVDLSLPFDEWFELLMDYKEGFEETRIRKGYSRLPEGPRRKEVEPTDMKTLNTLSEFSIDQIQASLSYLSKLEIGPIAARARVRALVIALCLWEHEETDSDHKNVLAALITKILDSITCEDLLGTFEDLRKNFTNDDPLENETSFVEFLQSHVGVRDITTGSSLAQLIRYKIVRDSS